jgi:hypothetical protein
VNNAPVTRPAEPELILGTIAAVPGVLTIPPDAGRDYVSVLEAARTAVARPARETRPGL